MLAAFALFAHSLALTASPDAGPPSPAVAWKVPLGDWTGATPVLATDGEQVVVDDSGAFALIDARTGRRTATLPYPAEQNRPSIELILRHDDVLALGEASRGEGSRGGRITTLARLARRGGKPSWVRVGAGSPPVTWEGDRVFIRDLSEVASLDAATGKPSWSVEDPQGLGPGVAVTSKVVVTTGDGSAAGLERSSGKLLWQRAVTGSVLAPPTACGGTVITAWTELLPHDATTSHLIALEPSTGAVLWSRDLVHAEVFFPPVCSTDTVFVVSAGTGAYFGELGAYDLKTGRTRWAQPVSTDVNHDYTPQLTAHEVLLWTGDAETFRTHAVSAFYRLVAYDLATGAVRWAYRPTTEEKFSFSRPVVAQGRVIYSDGSALVGLTPTSAP